MLLHTVATMAPTLPILEEAGSPPANSVVTDGPSVGTAAASDSQPQASNRQLKRVRGAATREQKASYESAFPDHLPEWLARCKED